MARRRSKADRFIDAMIENHEREPAGDVEVTLPNPGNKLLMYLGRPVKEEFYKVGPNEEVLGEYRCRRCTFRLPIDWHLVSEPAGEWETVVARQDGTGRVVTVQNRTDGLALSEVLG